MTALVFEQKIDLPYVYTAGPAQRGALAGLREGRLVGSAADGYIAVPACPFAPDGRHLRELVELRPEGVIEAVSVAHHIEGSPIFGLIRIDGASEPMLHRLDRVLQVGSRVRAVWNSERVGSVTDIDCFVAA